MITSTAKSTPSPASLMLASLAIDYSQDDATVALAEMALERARDQRARDWLASLPAT